MVLSDFLNFFTLLLVKCADSPLFFFIYSVIVVQLVLLIVKSLLHV